MVGPLREGDREIPSPGTIPLFFMQYPVAVWWQALRAPVCSLIVIWPAVGTGGCSPGIGIVALEEAGRLRGVDQRKRPRGGQTEEVRQWDVISVNARMLPKSWMYGKLRYAGSESARQSEGLTVSAIPLTSVRVTVPHCVPL
jgi:hypothetical protein